MDSPENTRAMIEQRVAQATQELFDNKASQAAMEATSPDSMVTVELNGAGDLTRVEINTQQIPEELRRKISNNIRLAWKQAAGRLARTEVENSIAAQRPELMRMAQNQIDQRFNVEEESDSEDDMTEQRNRSAQWDDDHYDEGPPESFLR